MFLSELLKTKIWCINSWVKTLTNSDGIKPLLITKGWLICLGLPLTIWAYTLSTLNPKPVAVHIPVNIFFSYFLHSLSYCLILSSTVFFEGGCQSFQPNFFNPGLF